MARINGPKCRLCRREGVKLYLKGSRCDSPKCSLARRDYPPGVQTFFRRKMSDYGLQLREKQKVKRYYGVFEKQFRRYFAAADGARGNTGENLLQLLERRLDNVVCVSGMALSRPEARQMICHGHIMVNGGKVDIASYQVKPDDVISVRSRDSSTKWVKSRLSSRKGAQVPSWLNVDHDAGQVRVVSMPNRDEVTLPIQEQLIVELCSK